MRVLTALAFVLCFMSYSAQADEFGPRFYAHAPMALGEYTAPEASVQNIAMDDQMAKDLQDIAPAAGEAAVEETPEADTKDAPAK